MVINVFLPRKGNFRIEYVYIVSLFILFDSAVYAWAAHMHRPHYVEGGCAPPSKQCAFVSGLRSNADVGADNQTYLDIYIS